MAAYAELQVTSNYSFLRGGSHPDELVLAAKVLGLAALGIADRNTLAGVVRAHVAAKQAGLKLLVGARLVPGDGPEILCYPTGRAAYGRLCRLLTLGKRRAEKGDCRFTLAELEDHGAGQILIVLPPESPDPAFRETLARLGRRFSGSCYLAGQVLYRGDDARRLERLNELAQACETPLVATNDVRLHSPARRALLDALTCVREHCTIDTAGFRLDANAERHLKGPDEMARLFRNYPEAIARGIEIAERCRFNLDELRYEYPEELTAPGRTPQEELAEQTRIGAAARYPGGVPGAVQAILDHELALIGQLGYAPYFLTVHDIVRFARARGILCQGRGSAANSAVCYCLGITAVDPARVDLLFERFVSAERDEPPDIDVDFEHERREEVIQYIYAKYGRDRAGLAATVICYRSRGALRDIGKAMGLGEDTLSALSGLARGWRREGDGVEDQDADLRELGLDPNERRLRQTLDLVREAYGFPRHLSQHVGGFVMTRGRLDELVPIANAAMEDRTVVEWDKDDLDALGILKVDVLGLGMLTCLRKGFELLAQHTGQRYDLATVPAEDGAVYDMLCRGDSLGVFQVESRAQMSMLPRLKPRGFYDLVIEVAIVRPGPIQGDMVHPYLRRRNGEEKVDYPSKALEDVLGKTLGVPLFQEQAMKIAIVGAGFTPSEADQLRRAMATFRHTGTIHTFHDKMIEGMAARGYDRDFAERCFRQIEGFGNYGFPESHAASFALLVYVSAWLKRHHPAVFAAALLNSQPMGFYAPAQIIRDAREHGVETRAVDVNLSDWDCTLEPALPGGVGDVQGAPLTPTLSPTFSAQREGEGSGLPAQWGRSRDGGDGLALRLGLRQVKGLAVAEAEALIAHRGNGYAEPRALWRRAGLGARALEALARADAFRSLDLDRRQALWAIKGLPGAGVKSAAPLPLFAAARAEELGEEPAVALPEMRLSEHVADDYASLRFSLKAHPVSFLRAELRERGMVEAARLFEWPNDKPVKVAGLVLVRQRPGTAKGVIFATLEDETGTVNTIVWPDLYARQRKVLLSARLLGIEGRLQREGLVIHVIAKNLIDLSPYLATLSAPPDAMPDAVVEAEARSLYRARDFR